MNALIAVPAMETMHTLTAHSMLAMRMACPSRFSFVIRCEVATARNMLAFEAIDSGVDRVLWLDSDMVFPDDLMLRLNKDIDDGWDMVCGLYFTRALPLRPVIYQSIDHEAAKAQMYLNYPQDQVFPIAGCGFGAVMMTTELLKRLGDEPFTPFRGAGEDLSFCVRAKEAGARIACDSRAKVGHLGLLTFSERSYKHPGG